MENGFDLRKTGSEKQSLSSNFLHRATERGRLDQTCGLKPNSTRNFVTLCMDCGLSCDEVIIVFDATTKVSHLNQLK